MSLDKLGFNCYLFWIQTTFLIKLLIFYTYIFTISIISWCKSVWVKLVSKLFQNNFKPGTLFIYLYIILENI